MLFTVVRIQGNVGGVLIAAVVVYTSVFFVKPCATLIVLSFLFFAVVPRASFKAFILCKEHLIVLLDLLNPGQEAILLYF
jgi:hypothetical protein